MEMNRMKRSMVLTVTVLAAVLLGAGTLAAQKNRGEKALNAYDYDKAIAAFKTQVQGKGTKPSWCDDMFQLAYSHYMIHEYPEAQAVLDDLLANADRLGCNDIYRVSSIFYWRGRPRSRASPERRKSPPRSFLRPTAHPGP
jgi:hypothetical protein